MSEYQQFLKERGQIDYLLQTGFKISKITENLNGSIVDFTKSKNENGKNMIQTLQILTPNARKYFSGKLIQQQKNQG